MNNATTGQKPAILSLWDEACRLAAQLPLVFGEPASLASTGLSRRLALRCCNWLWSIEALVRRVLIAAALALDPKKLAPLRMRSGAHSGEPAQAAERPPRFRLFAFAASARRGARRSSAPPRPYGHVPFPADDILRLGALPPLATRSLRDRAILECRDRGAIPSGRSDLAEPNRGGDSSNPLHRRGRISRWDPDYRGQQTHQPRPQRSRPAGPRRRHEPVSALHRLPVSTEWRRVEEEWERVLPAPHLASRLAALQRVIAQPMRWVNRLARRLQKTNIAARLSARKPPILRRPKLDATPPFDLDNLIARAQSLMRPDTS